jgi:5'-nucleotidase
MALSWKTAAVFLVCALAISWLKRGKSVVSTGFESLEALPSDHYSQHAGSSILNLSLLATNDLHSAVTGVGPESLPQSKRGGYARLASVLKRLRNVSVCLFRRLISQDNLRHYLTVDAGDWYAGSLFDQLGPNGNTSFVPELEYFHASHYDAINLGNHDFDSTDRGLAYMMSKAEQRGLRLPFVASNMQPMTSPLSEFFGRASNVSLQPFVVKTFPSAIRPIRVGILGLFGPDAALCSTGTRGPVTFAGFRESVLEKDMNELNEHARSMVSIMRDVHEVDIVVVLLHGGPVEASELAAAVPGIDAIASGHTHETYYLAAPSSAFETNEARTTHVVQCGHSGRSLGVLNFFVDADMKLHLASPAQCVAVDAAHGEDTHIQTLVRGWQAELPRVLNSSFAYEQVVHRGRDGDLFNSSHDYLEHARVVSNLLLSEVNARLERMGHAPADVYLTCPTCVRTRAHASQGEVILQYSDIYRMLSISTSCDMVVFHMRREDLWMVLNFVVILEKILSREFVLTLGGVQYEVGAWGIPFVNYFQNLRFERADGSSLPYDEWPALVRVATST